MKTLKKFWEELKEWFADLTDPIKLVFIGDKIDRLNDDLEWETNPVGRREILVQLDFYSQVHNDILLRIRKRDARYDKHQPAH